MSYKIATVIGNGPSLTPELLESLEGETWACNRIWKMFEYTHWRPTHYVRAEVPDYAEKDVVDDLKHIGLEPIHLHIHDGFRGYAEHVWSYGGPMTVWDFFTTCDGSEHDWHLPKVCGYGSVVHIAMQLAVLDGADEIRLVGCDLGTPAHFYGNEGTANDALLINAHRIAERCCPVPIIRSINDYC